MFPLISCLVLVCSTILITVNFFHCYDYYLAVGEWGRRSQATRGRDPRPQQRRLLFASAGRRLRGRSGGPLGFFLFSTLCSQSKYLSKEREQTRGSSFLFSGSRGRVHLHGQRGSRPLRKQTDRRALLRPDSDTHEQVGRSEKWEDPKIMKLGFY